MPPRYQPSEPPPDDAVYAGHDPRQNLAELLTLTWDFLAQASPPVHHELAAFLTTRGYHPITGPGSFLDSLQFTAASLTTPPPGSPPPAS